RLVSISSIHRLLCSTKYIAASGRLRKFFPALSASCGQDEVAGSPTGFGARWWRDVGVLDLFPVLWIERLAIAEHGLSREVIEIHELIGKRILIRRVMGNAVAWFPPFVGRHALRAVVERRSRQPKALRDDFRLYEVHRIGRYHKDGQEVAVAEEAPVDGGLVGQRHASLANEPRLHVRGPRSERAAFPTSHREAGVRMECVFGRPWAAIHPDDHFVPVFPRADLVRHDAVRDGIG